MSNEQTTQDGADEGAVFNVATLGDGWASQNARDLMRVAVVLGGYEPMEMLRRIYARTARRPSAITNMAPVCAVLDEMLHEARPDRRATQIANLRRLRPTQAAVTH